VRIICGPPGVEPVVTEVRDSFSYSNRNEQPPGPWISLASRVIPGVARVQEQVAPYAAAWRDANAIAAAAEGPLWVALGDSLSQGIGAPAWDLGWVGQLHARLALAGRDYRIVNLSVSGARTGDVLARQLPALEALPVAPDLVTVMIGSNDLVRRRYRNGLPDRFRALLERVPEGTVVSTLPNPTPTATAVNAVIADAARERGLVVADMRDGRTTSWRGKLAADHFHPNEVGYAALARIFADALLPLS
jgi:lysophospholipase L1-like esterase